VTRDVTDDAQAQWRLTSGPARRAFSIFLSRARHGQSSELLHTSSMQRQCSE